MKNLYVSHAEIIEFADTHVNLKRDDVKDYRDQANRLRDKLEEHIAAHPEHAVVKTLFSGSLAKGTALKDIDDIDLAVYVSEADAPSAVNELIPWLADRIRKAFPNFKPEQVVENDTTITVLYSSSGLKVDVVPVFYGGDKDWKGHLVSKRTGDKILTSIPQHIKFIAARKQANKTHYRQLVRLMKYWVKQRRNNDVDFRFKSFMVELLVAHLADKGLIMDDYPEALAQIFAHIARDSFSTSIAFNDYYEPALCVEGNYPIHIWDPVNHQNNVASRYSVQQRDAIINAALEAGDDIAAAMHAPSKSEAIRYWRKVFGPAFDL